MEKYLDNRTSCFLIHLNYGTRTDEDRRRIWEYGRAHRLIGLDLSDVNMDWNDMSPDEKEAFRLEAPQWHSQFEMFCNDMAKGDLVIVTAGHSILLGLGEITQSRYDYDPELKNNRIFFDHTRGVKWLFALDYDNQLRLATPLKGFNRTLLRISPDHKYWKILAKVDI
jgi:hypothetical protein